MVTQSDVSVLTDGQSGTGKEVFAQVIHNASPRSQKPFIATDCGALPEQLLESELFGHIRGTLIGAVSNREGLLQVAEGGTLFLDEINDMPASSRMKLLCALQERKVRPLGSNHDIDTGVRTVSVTHHDLFKAMTRSKFCKDLYYRLGVVSLEIPVPAGRTEDIPLPANRLLRQSVKRHKPFVHASSTDATKRSATASWPGNVHQLVNVTEQCTVLTSSPVISNTLVEQALEGKDTVPLAFIEACNQLELNYLHKLLQITRDNMTHAARMAGRNRIEFYKLLPRHELDASDFKEQIRGLCQLYSIKRQAILSRSSTKKIDAIIKPLKLDDTREALAEAGIIGMTITEVKDFGRQKDHIESHHDAEYMADFLSKVKIKIVVTNDIVSTRVDITIRTAQTGKIGDGKIFVFDVTRVIRIRTGEEGGAAV